MDFPIDIGINNITALKTLLTGIEVSNITIEGSKSLFSILYIFIFILIIYVILLCIIKIIQICYLLLKKNNNSITRTSDSYSEYYRFNGIN
jgi:hypothetical protein